jgi:serine/threonine protein kinase
MSDFWKRWEGQVVDHKYQLQNCLGSTDHSAVFCAEFRDPEPRKATIKFISLDIPDVERQVADWETAALLSHPNLARIYGTGKCKIDDREMLYVAMEYAEENLGEILPQRALQPDEAREVLNTVVDVLVFLHDKNLVHGHVKPSNILAQGDQLKVSSDTIRAAGELREMSRQRSAYDAPEITSSPYTPAADIWSLGVTLVEALTQQPAVLPYNENADPVVPAEVREPLSEIAKHALRRNPRSRWASGDIAKWLNPAAAVGQKAVAAAAARASAAPAAPVATAPPPPPVVAPLNVPLSKERAVPLAKQTPVSASRVPVVPRSVGTEPRQTVVLPNYVVPVLAGVLILVAIIVLPKILRNREQSQANSAPASASSTTSSAPAENASSAPKSVQSSKPPAASSLKIADSAKSTAPERPAPTPKQSAATATTEPAVLRSTTSAPAPKISSASPGRGEVLDQILPEPPAKALATIQGTVRVGVKVHVDEAGNVSDTSLDSPGPSRYFADLSLKAARRWVFNSPEADGHSVPSDWLIYFQFTQSGVQAVPQQVAP